MATDGATDGPADGPIKLVDGSAIRKALPSLEEGLLVRCQALDRDSKGLLSAQQFREAAVVEVAALHPGVAVPPKRLVPAFAAVAMGAATESDPEPAPLEVPAFAAKMKEFLEILAELLLEDPLVVEMLDGESLKVLLEDEDDFAILAEDLFTELDTDDSGKLSYDELNAALLKMGTEMGVPILEGNLEAAALIKSLLEKYKAEDKLELGQSQFAKLLQGIIQDIADSLAAHPLAVIIDVRVNNGYQLKKILTDKQKLSEMSNKIFENVDANKDGKLVKNEVRNFLEINGIEFGIPTMKQNHTSDQIFNDVFQLVDADKSGALDKKEFEVLIEGIFTSFQEQLEGNPVFIVDEEDL